MLSIIVVIVGFVGLGLAVALGWTADTTRPGKCWYPAGPDPEPWRTE